VKKLYRNSYRNNNQEAVAQIKGSNLAPGLSGEVVFRDAPNGTMVYVDVSGLPPYQPAQGDNPPIGPFGFHLHENGECAIGDENNPYTSAGGHYNPDNQPHGNHAGDFPVLFSNNGRALMSFFTDRFKVKDIVGKSVLVHQNPDDYRSQPSGAAGKRIGCGIVNPVEVKR